MKFVIDLFVRLIVLDEIERLLFGDTIDYAHFVSEANTVELVRKLQQLRTKGGRDELSLVAQLVNHVGH